MRRFRSILAVCLTLLCLIQFASCIKRMPGDDTTTTTYTGELPTGPNGEDLPPSPPPALQLPTWTDAEATADLFLTTATAIVDCSEREYSYAEMVEDLQTLKNVYPEHFDYRVFGQSAAGRDLYVATLGNPDAEKQFLVSAGIHGREYLTPLLVMKQIEFYLAYYDAGDYNGFAYDALFDEFCFYIVPMTNPDGIMLAQAGIYSISDAEMRQRIIETYYKDYAEKYTQQTNINEYLKIWKSNANAVDLNRNFDALWEYVNTGMYRPSHKLYKGDSVASEPETQAMVALTESLPNIQAVLCIHSQGEVLYWDCGQTGVLREETQGFAEAIGMSNGYRVIYEQNNDASYSDWCTIKKGLISVTVETGLMSEAGPLSITQFPTIWMDNFDLLALSAAHFTAGK